jgi:hypothetical protein
MEPTPLAGGSAARRGNLAAMGKPIGLDQIPTETASHPLALERCNQREWPDPMEMSVDTQSGRHNSIVSARHAAIQDARRRLGIARNHAIRDIIERLAWDIGNPRNAGQ